VLRRGERTRARPTVVWSPGQTIVHQEVWRGRVWAARPLTVVRDDGDRLLLWIPEGTVRKVPVAPPGREAPARWEDQIIESLDRGDWVYGENVWDVSTLWIVHPGDWHAVWVSWLAGRHYGWYVNLQRPFRRTAIGIEAMDLMLDVVAEPDLTWRWKDEAQFDEIVDRAIFDPDTAARVRQEAAAVIRGIERAEPPFSEPWPAWRPDPSWATPTLVDGWDRPM
jgi:protein associated with RNAse G/E